MKLSTARLGVLILVLTVGFISTGCGMPADTNETRETPASDEAARLNGQIGLPANSTVQSHTLKVVNSLGSVDVGPDGRFALNALSNDPQFTVVLSPAGNPMLLSFLDVARNEINARSTAEVLLYFGMKCYLLPGEGQVEMLELLSEASEVDGVARAIEQSLARDPDSLSKSNTEVTRAIRDAAEALCGKHGPTKSLLRSMMLIQPSEQRSGIDVIHAPAINTVDIVNNYRRRGYVFIEQTEYIRESDGRRIPEVKKHDASDFWMPPVEGVGDGFFATLGGIFSGLYGVGPMAYEPISLGEFDMPLRAGSKQTTYEITIVGAGASAGDSGLLNSEEQNAMYLTWAATLGQDLIMPALVNVILPIKNYGGALSIIQAPSMTGVLEDFLNAVKDTPGVMDAMQRGEVGEALTTIWTHLSYDNSTLRTVVAHVMGAVLSVFHEQGLITDPKLLENYTEGVLHAGKIFNVLGIVDLVLGIGDLGAVMVHTGWSNRADIWTIDVLAPQVKISPEEAEIERFQYFTLTAAVPELTGHPAGDVNLEYRWRCTENAGSIADSLGHSAADFTSTSNNVTYFADGDDPGEDTITVTVTQIRVGGHPTLREEVGTVTAQVTVLGTAVQLTPRESTIDPEETVDLSITLNPQPAANVEVEYHWTNSANHGELTDGASVDDFVTDNDTTVYKADEIGGGTDTVHVDVYGVSMSGRQLLGTAEATVEVNPFEVTLSPAQASLEFDDHQAFNVTIEPTLPPTANIVYRWTCTGEYGELRGGNEHDSDTPTATYDAGTDAEGEDHLAVEVLREVDGVLVVIGADDARISVHSAATITLSPSLADVAWDDAKTLNVTIDPAPDPNQTIIFHWTNTGAYGHLTGGDDHESESADAHFVAGSGAEGSDTVAVSVYKLVDGERVFIGSDTSAMNVRERIVSLSDGYFPVRDIIRVGNPEHVPEEGLYCASTQDLRAYITPALPDGEAVMYRFSNPAAYGDLTNTDGAMNNFDSGDNLVTYRARSTGYGTDVVAVEVYRDRGAGWELVGSAQRNLQVSKLYILHRNETCLPCMFILSGAGIRIEIDGVRVYTMSVCHNGSVNVGFLALPGEAATLILRTCSTRAAFGFRDDVYLSDQYGNHTLFISEWDELLPTNYVEEDAWWHNFALPF